MQYVNQDDNRQHSLVNADHVVDNVDARVDIDYVNRFPKWDWHYAEIICDWIMQNAPCRPRDWGYSNAMWNETLNFFQSLKWRRAEDTFVSVYELGIYFWLKVKSPPSEVIKGFSGRLSTWSIGSDISCVLSRDRRLSFFQIRPFFEPENVVGPVYSSCSVAAPLMRGTSWNLPYVDLPYPLVN